MCTDQVFGEHTFRRAVNLTHAEPSKVAREGSKTSGHSTPSSRVVVSGMCSSEYVWSLLAGAWVPAAYAMRGITLPNLTLGSMLP